MAYILRSIAVIGVIALNSPVHDEKSDGGAAATIRGIAQSAARIDAQSAVQGMTAAREAAEIMTGLDPETRQRLLAMALPQKPR